MCVILQSVYLIISYLASFTLSDLGKACITPVDNAFDCSNAYFYFNMPNRIGSKLQFVSNMKGNGRSLPKGCVIDSVETDDIYVYWNPKGVALSSDVRIKQVCFGKQ